MFASVFERGMCSDLLLIAVYVKSIRDSPGSRCFVPKRQLNLATFLPRIYFSTHHPQITQRLSKQLLKIFFLGRIKQVWRCLTILYSQLGSKMVTFISNRLPAVDRFSDLRKGSTLDIPRQLRRNKPRAFGLFAPLHPKCFWPVK